MKHKATLFTVVAFNEEQEDFQEHSHGGTVSEVRVSWEVRVHIGMFFFSLLSGIYPVLEPPAHMPHIRVKEGKKSNEKKTSPHFEPTGSVTQFLEISPKVGQRCGL